jgi:hypothetical protein
MSRLLVASSFGDSVFSLQPFLMEIVAEAVVVWKRRHFAPELCNVTGREANDMHAALTVSRADAKSKGRLSESKRGLICARTVAGRELDRKQLERGPARCVGAIG